MGKQVAKPRSAVGPVEGAAPVKPLARDEQDRYVLTVDQAAKRVQMGLRNFYDRVLDGTVFSIKIGSRRYVPVEALELWIRVQMADQGYDAWRHEFAEAM